MKKLKKFFCFIKQKISYFLWESKKPFFIVILTFIAFIFIFSFIYMFIAYNDSGTVFKKRKSNDTFVKKAINLNFKEDGELIISKTDSVDLDFSKISFVDKYYSLEWLIILPGDYSDLFDKNLFFLDNSFIEFVSIENSNDKKTILRIKEKDIFAVDIFERENYLKIYLKNPKDVYDKIVVIDPAHGGMDFGVNNGAIMEKDMTLKICEKIEELSLKSDKFKIYLTRNSDEYIKDEERIFFANQYADLFLSVNISSIDRYNFSDKSEIYYHNYNDYDLSAQKCSEILKNSIQEYFSFSDFKIYQKNKNGFENINSLALFFEIGYNADNDYSQSFFQMAAMGIYDGINKIFE